MTWYRTKHRKGSIGYFQLDKAIRTGRFAYMKCAIAPQATTNADSTTGASVSGAPTGTGGDVNNCRWVAQVGGLVSQYHILGTQTILGPVATANGVNLTQDATDNDGSEHAWGGCEIATAYQDINPFKNTVGTSADSILRAKFRIADVSGTDDCNFGWRKGEAFQANVDDYADGFWINVNNGVLVAESMVGGAATTSTTLSNYTWADGATHTLEIRLKQGGTVSVKYDDAPVAGVHSYTFTAALDLIPFTFLLQATTTPGAVELDELWVGDYSAYQEFSGASGVDV